MEKDAVMFILQGGLAVLMLLFGIVLNGMRASIDRVSTELKVLNDAVLGKYVTRDDADARWRDQRALDHELRGMIQQALVDVAKVRGIPYEGPK